MPCLFTLQDSNANKLCSAEIEVLRLRKVS